MTVEIKAGTSVRILTANLPDWVPAGGIWYEYLTRCNGRIATVYTEPKFLAKINQWTDPRTHNILWVSLAEFPNFFFAIDWLVPHSRTPIKTTCDCPLPVLMSRGCKNPSHQ